MKTYKDELAGALHEPALGLLEAGLLPKSTMREVDDLCLAPGQNLTPEQIKGGKKPPALAKQHLHGR